MRNFRSTRNVIRLSLRGCTNRPFYHIVVMRNRQPRDKRVRDQIGTYDPMPNIHNEKLVSINFQKLTSWMSHGALCSQPVEILLGYAGFFPIHPYTRIQAFRKTRGIDNNVNTAPEIEEIENNTNDEAEVS